ncbi:putative Niemann-Pick C1 protein isoform X4 [Penaeus vannamei]|uniref:Putative Niemann-Pick C1 protein isoform X4 n=1 Tax=Penaeus vannamei TaxID=6689 RepID=A0A3R7QPB7_PENVA|nr:putative Niemann-Pick C1 protein isoform X4 [Penaeus vannamei]
MAFSWTSRAILLVAAVAVGLFITTKAEVPKEGHCIWYGMCHKNPQKNTTDKSMFLNCAYEGPAKLLENATAIDAMKTHCPELLDEITAEDGSISTCCGADNILDMTTNFGQLDAFVNRCPACMTNIKKNFCYFTCHPRHSTFLMPTALYESKCQIEYWQQTGWATEDLEGVSNIYDNATLTMHPFDVPTTPCNSSDPAMHCLCSDCRSSCPTLPETPEEGGLPMVGSIDALTFSLILIYLVGVVVIVTASCCWSKRYGGSPTAPDNVGDPGCFEKLSAKMEKSIKRGFSVFARFVAKHPFFFIFVGLVPVLLLSIGIMYLQLTTDPVELWASPTSRSRKDKDYFDSHFAPFYRTTQIIIKAKNYDWFNVTTEPTPGAFKTYRFGPALNETFLMEVMTLQNEIENLVGKLEGENGPENVTLRDVCIKPLAPQEDDCLIQSVVNYWQNDPEELQKDIDEGDFEFARHFISCVSNPVQLSPDLCLGSYGGPIFPYTALGGFLKEDDLISDSPSYWESTALVITILLANQNDKSLLGPALAWEERFLEYMKEIVSDGNLTLNMDIAYNAERGIEDELARESMNDLLTILISYLIMFAYVAIALGNVSSECRRLFVSWRTPFLPFSCPSCFVSVFLLV